MLIMSALSQQTFKLRMGGHYSHRRQKEKPRALLFYGCELKVFNLRYFRKAVFCPPTYLLAWVAKAWEMVEGRVLYRWVRGKTTIGHKKINKSDVIETSLQDVVMAAR